MLTDKQLEKDVMPFALNLKRDALETFAAHFQTSTLFWECVLRPSPWAKSAGASYVHRDAQNNVRSIGIVFRQCQQELASIDKDYRGLLSVPERVERRPFKCLVLIRC